MSKFNIGEEFSHYPSGRYYQDSKDSGERFREEFLRKKLDSLEEGECLEVVLDDGVHSYGSSFLTEGFAGMVKYGYIRSDELLDKLHLCYTDEDYGFYAKRIVEFIREAKYKSEEYKPSK